MYLKLTYFCAHVTKKYREHGGILRAQDKFRKPEPQHGSVFYGFKDIITRMSMIRFNTNKQNLFIHILPYVFSNETTIRQSEGAQIQLTL